MPKLSLERFREIKERTKEFQDLVEKLNNEEIELSDEEEAKLEEEIEAMSAEIHSSDLSDIPFEEYDGFFDVGFNFEGTGANLDYSLIRSDGWNPVRLKGCNVRNFDFDKQRYDGKSFDEDFMIEHPDRFISRDLPEDVQLRFYHKALQTEDIIRYELYDLIGSGRLSSDAAKFFERVSPEVARKIVPEMFEDSTLSYYIMKEIEEYEGEVTEEVVTKIITDNIESVLTRPYLSVDSYKRIVNNPALRAFIPEEQIIDFGDNDDLAEDFLEDKLSIAAITRYPETFRGKKFVNRFSGYRYSPEDFDGITEGKIFYLIDNYPDVVQSLLFEPAFLYSIVRNINPEGTREENYTAVQDRVIEILNSTESRTLDLDTKKTLERYYSIEAVRSMLSEFDRSELDEILKQTTEEKMASYGITPKILEDRSVRDLFLHYGLETVMEFDRANGNVFSKDNFALAKMMSLYYFHYAGNEHNPDRTIYYRSGDPETWVRGAYSLEDFEECVRRMIVVGPTDWDYSSEQPIDFRDFSDSFKARYPRMFLSKDAPLELQNKFYKKTLDIGDFGIHPDWIEFLEGKDFEVGLNSPYVSFRDTKRYDHRALFDMLRKVESSEGEILKFINANSKTIKMMEIYQRMRRDGFGVDFDEIHNLDELRGFCEREVETLILNGSLPYGEPYIPEFFKEKHPELVLDENAPEELKAKFYSLYFREGSEENSADRHPFTISDLINEEYQPFLRDKSFELLRNADQVKNITRIFSVERIADLYKIDPEAFEVYCQSAENAMVLKTVLDNYPEQYAKEEMMQGLRITEEEFEKRLQDPDFRSKFDALKNGYFEDFVRNPGFVLFLEPEKQSRETLRQYKELSSINMFRNSNRYSRDSYEQILGHMLGFLGFEEARKLLEVPEIDEETLSRIYQQDEVIKSLYEKKFEIAGNMKVISKLLEGFPGLMPTAEKLTSKNTCKLFVSLNKRISEGYDKDISSLITEILAENNIEIDEEKARQLVESVVKTSTQQKLDLVRENNSVLIDTSIEENQKTKNMIKIHYRNALEYSLNKAEKVDPALVREYLEMEFSRVREDGQPYYSPHVTDHLEELVGFATTLTLDPEWSAKLNHSVVDDLTEESRKIGKGWIRKITSNVCLRPDKLTYEEAERLDAAIYPEGSGIEVETKPTIGLKKLSEEEKKKVYDLLTQDDFRGLFTYGKAENMFSALKTPYSVKFKEYFLKHKDEFIGNPDLFAKFTLIASKFDVYLEDAGFNTRYTEGTLTPEDILLKISTDVYPNITIGQGEHEVIYQAREGGLSEEQAKIALRLFGDMRKREYQTVPQEQFETKRFRGRIVRMDDPLHFAIGEITNCCQTIGEGQPGETSMIHSATERNGALFVVEELDEMGRPIGIVSQSWTWRNGNRVCFDNVEVPHAVESQLKQVGGFDEIMEVYQEAARRMIDTDREKLKKLLESGKITQKQYESMLIKDVGMGLGCDNLVGNLSQEKRKSISSLGTVSPIEAGKTYTGAHSRTLYSDSARQVLIAHNDDFERDDHTHSGAEVGDYGIKYTKTRDIFRRKGFDIDPDKISAISKVMQKNGQRNSSFSDNPLNISEVVSHFGIRDLKMADADRIRISMSESGDWYILYEETESGIVMLESGIDTSKPKTDMETQDRKMALGEYTREVHKMMLESAIKGIPMTIDSDSSRLVNIESLKEEGIISVENGAIVVTDKEKLEKKFETFNKTIDEQRRERLTINEEESEK